MFEMLSGEPPYVSPNRKPVMAHHVKAKPPSVHSVRPKVPREVFEVNDRQQHSFLHPASKRKGDQRTSK